MAKWWCTKGWLYLARRSLPGSITPSIPAPPLHPLTQAPGIVLATLAIYSNGTNPVPLPSISGLGLTWTLIKKYDTQNQTFGEALCIWAGVGAAQAGAITFTSGQSGSNYASWLVELLTGVDNADPTVQEVTGGGPGGASETITLAAFSSPSNGTYGVFVPRTTSPSSITPGAGFAIVSQQASTTLNHTLTSIFAADNRTSVTVNSSGNVAWDGIGLELKAIAAATSGVFGNRRTLLGVG